MKVNDLPEELRMLALQNCDYGYMLGDHQLSVSFDWSKSPEGYEFWSDANSGRFKGLIEDLKLKTESYKPKKDEVALFYTARVAGGWEKGVFIATYDVDGLRRWAYRGTKGASWNVYTSIKCKKIV